MTNVLLEHKSCLPIVSHTRAIKFCNELGFSSRMKITDLTSIFKFKVFYFIFKHMNINGFGVLAEACVYEMCNYDSLNCNTSTDAFRAFVQAVRENVVIHDKLQSSTNYDESVKFRVAELFETNK